MKKKYSTQDGRIVELDGDEFLHYPFNARLMLMDKVDEKIVEPKLLKDEYEKELRVLVGLSIKRTQKVMEMYPTKDELLKNLNKLPFDDIENKVIKDYYNKLQFDLNGDGKFDDEDKSLAGKVLRKKIKKGEN